MRHFWLALATALIIALVSFLSSDHSLHKGQVVKQFHTYSIGKSLAENGFDILQTYLPCKTPGSQAFPRHWVEEPPLHHLFTAVLIKLGIHHPAAAPTTLAFFLVLVIFCLVQLLESDRVRAQAISCLVVFCPIFMRYTFQHIPEYISLLGLLLGVVFLLKNRFGLALFFFTLAVTAKALAIFAVAPILFAFLEANRRPYAFARWAAACTLVSVPFLIWLWILHSQNIPNPFFIKDTSSLRHTGAWGMLVSPVFYGRMWTWWVTAGVGLALFIGFLVSMTGALRNWRKIDPQTLLMVFWALGLIPYWILVRHGNFVHDYYFLPFFVPMAYLGARAILRIPMKPLRWLVILVSIGIGIRQPLKQQLIAKDISVEPRACEAEVGWWG